MPGQGSQIYSRDRLFHNQRSVRPITNEFINVDTKLTFIFILLENQYIGLQILEKVITTRWKSLPEGQRQGECHFPFNLVEDFLDVKLSFLDARDTEFRGGYHCESGI